MLQLSIPALTLTLTPSDSVFQSDHDQSVKHIYTYRFIPNGSHGTKHVTYRRLVPWRRCVGYPENVKAPEDQQKHIDDYYEKDGVRGDPASIFIFTSQPGEWIPPLGPFLGDLTSELDCGEREENKHTPGCCL